MWPLLTPAPAAAPLLAEPVRTRIEASVTAARSAGTRRAYTAAWRRFTSWCGAEGHPALPAHPATGSAYLAVAADTLTEGRRAYAPSTLAKWVAAIAHQHRTAGYPSPPATSWCGPPWPASAATTPPPANEIGRAHV